MATTSQPVSPRPTGRQSFGTRMNQFWQRVTDGLELNQLWSQFRTDANASYRLYSRGIDYTRKEGVKKGRHWRAECTHATLFLNHRLELFGSESGLLLSPAGLSARADGGIS